MKECSAALAEMLNNSRQIYPADLFTITLRDGTILRYTSCDTDLTVGGYRFLSVAIERGKTRQTIGLEVDDLEITMYTKPEYVMPNGESVQKAMRSGAFDNAYLALHVLFSPTPWQYNMPPLAADYTMLHFLGRMDIDEGDGTKTQIKVRSLTDLLEVKQPQNLIMPSCLHTLYVGRCGVIKANYTVACVALAGSTTTQIITGLTQESGYFDQGEIRSTSGLNSGYSRSVRSHSGGLLQLSVRLPNPIQAGDTFDVCPGCDRTKYTCGAKFNNLSNFRGYPYVPVPETLL